MIWTIPTWWQLTLLALGTFRVFRLISEDTIFDRPRAWILGVPGWRPGNGEPPPSSYRRHLATFITCPWCCGFWLSVALWLTWSWQPHWTLVAVAPFAINAVVGLVTKNLDR